MKRLTWKVNLNVTEDDYGLKGFMLQGSENKNFNAFYNTEGIFHDVFEHWFEECILPYDIRYQVEGEVIAMGVANYIHHNFRINPLYKHRHDPDNDMAGGAMTFVEGLSYDESRDFIERDIFKADVPNFRVNLNFADNCNADSLASLMLYKVRNAKNNLKEQLDRFTEYDKQEGLDRYKAVKKYMNSITYTKLHKLVRYGYYLGYKYFPEVKENHSMFQDFVSSVDEFCKAYDENELYDYINWVELQFTRNSKGEVSFKAIVEGHDIRLIGENEIPIIQVIEQTQEQVYAE